VIVLRGGLHGRRPLSRGGTARRLGVRPGRVRAAEHSGLARLRKADAKQGCGLRSAAGRRAAAQRLADGSTPALAPLPVAAPSPALVSTDSLRHGKHGELAAHGSSPASSSSGKPDQQTRRAGLVPTSGDEGSGLSPAVWISILAALALAAAGLVLFRRRAADPYGYGGETVASPYPRAWSPTDWESEQPDEPQQAAQEPPPAPTGNEPGGISWGAVAEDMPRPRKRDRAVQAAGGLAASGAVVSLLLGRLFGRRRRR
jgi:hypothetical protein